TRLVPRGSELALE
nr:Chain L, LINKER